MGVAKLMLNGRGHLCLSVIGQTFLGTGFLVTFFLSRPVAFPHHILKILLSAWPKGCSEFVREFWCQGCQCDARDQDMPVVDSESCPRTGLKTPGNITKPLGTKKNLMYKNESNQTMKIFFFLWSKFWKIFTRKSYNSGCIDVTVYMTIYIF